MPVRAQHPQRAQQPGRPAADPVRPAVPLAHQLRVDPQAQRVQEQTPAVAGVVPGRVHPYRLAVPDRTHQITFVLHAQVVGEVVQGAAGQHRERQAVPQGDPGGRVHRAVTTAHAQHPRPGRRLRQRVTDLLRRALHDLRLRQRTLQRPDPVGGARGPVGDHHQTLALRQRGCLGTRPGRAPHLGAGRHQPPHQEGRPHAERRPGQYVTREVHTRVHPGGRHRERHRRHHRAPGRGLQRDPGREGGGRRGMPRREGRGDRLPPQLPHQRHRVQHRPGPAHRALADRVDGQRRHAERGQAPQGRPAGPRGAARGHRGGRREPQHPVVRAAAEPGKHPLGARPVPGGGRLEHPAVQIEQPAQQAAGGRGDRPVSQVQVCGHGVRLP